MGLDTKVINLLAEAHPRIGYIECDRLVYFRKDF
jgi:hypothetical protein